MEEQQDMEDLFKTPNFHTPQQPPRSTPASSKTSKGTQKCSQLLLVGIIKTLTAPQREAIEAVGLGSLLKLKEVRIRRIICMKIADAYVPEKDEFNIKGHRLKITMQDVYHILGLPHEGDEITKLPKKKVLRLFEKFNWDYRESIPLSMLKEKLISIQTSDEYFVTLFLLYTIGVYLCPTTQASVKTGYLALIEDIEYIPKINWCRLVLNHSMSMIRKYKDKTQVNLAGNLILLQVWYWEKISLTHMYPEMSRHKYSKPLIQNWDEARAKIYTAFNRKFKFGEGKVVEDIGSPLNQSASTIDEERHTAGAESPQTFEECPESSNFFLPFDRACL